MALFLLQNQAVCAPVFALCVTHALRAVSMISVVGVIAAAEQCSTLHVQCQESGGCLCCIFLPLTCTGWYKVFTESSYLTCVTP